MAVTFRELPYAEWQTLVDQGIYPYATYGLPPEPVDGNWRILVAEDDGKIVGCTSLHTQVHWDPWFIESSHRGSAGIVRGLIKQGREELKAYGIDHVYCTIDDQQILTRDLADRLGFKPAPGQLYLLNVNDLEGV